MQDEKLSDADQAIGFCAEYVDADENNTFAYLELERLLRTKRALVRPHRDPRERRHGKGQAGGTSPAELALRVAIADVWEKELDSPDSAAEALEKVLQVAPTNVGALLSLARLHEGAERWTRRARRWRRRLPNAAAPAEIAEIQFRNAQILTRED